MRKSLYPLMIFMAVTAALWLLTDIVQARTEAKPGDFELIISSESTTFKLGDTPEFTAIITNNSSEKVNLVPALDGSSWGTRYPIVRWIVTAPPGTPEPESFGVCGNTNNIQPSDFISVSPDETFSPIARGWNYFPADQITAPGKYTVQLTYDTRGEATQWHGFMGVLTPIYKRKIKRLLNDVPKMHLTSNTITITVIE